MPMLPIDDFGQRVQALRPGAAGTLPIGSPSSVSTTFAATTTVIRLVANQPCFVALGAAPVATTGSHYLPGDAPEYFRVVPGERLAALAANADGTLYISEMV